MNDIQKEFVPYEEALALKELGFYEKCLAWYYTYEMSNFVKGKYDCRGEFNISYTNEDDYVKNSDDITYITAPTFSQAFRWIRERYNLLAIVSYCDDNSGKFMAVIDKINDDIDYDMNPKDTYEEAELECLRKLIKIIKEK